MTGRTFITKEAPQFDFDKRHSLDLGFQHASVEEMRKQMGITDLSEVPDGTIAGWASTADVDLAGHVVKAGAFDESIKTKGLSGPKGIKLLIQHDRDKPAGVITKLVTIGSRLWMEAKMNLNISYVKDFYEAAKDNGGLSFSVGFYLKEEDSEIIETKDMYQLHIAKAELEEVSVVVFPCQPNAGMTFIKDDSSLPSYETVAEFEKALVAKGLAANRNDAQAITRAVKAQGTLFAPAPVKPPVQAFDTKALDNISALVDSMRKMQPQD